MDKISKNDLENLKKLMEEHIPFTTGFRELDYFLSTTTQGDIITIGARPAVGKKSFTISIVNHLLKENKKVCYFSLEDKKEQLFLKFISNLSKIEPFYLMKENQKYSSAMNKYATELSKRELYIKAKAMLSVEEVEEDIKTVKPDVVVIDYIQALKMPKAPNLTEATNLAIQEIERIATENDVIVILISQLSRALETRYDKKPILSDLRNSSVLEELSDVVIFIYREDYYTSVIDQDERNKAEIIVAKNKYGSAGSCTLRCEKGFFTEVQINNIIKL